MCPGYVEENYNDPFVVQYIRGNNIYLDSMLAAKFANLHHFFSEDMVPQTLIDGQGCNSTRD